MGNSSAKKTNQLLDEQRRTTQGFGDELRGYGREDRGYQSGLRNDITNRYWDLYNSTGEDGGGGGGGGFASFEPTIADARMNEAMDFYRKAQNTGLFDQGQINDYRARTGMQNARVFNALGRQLGEGANIRGGGFAGYSGQRALLGRDAARQMEEARVNSELGLQDQIRQNMFRGGEGVGRYDTEFMGNQRQVEGLRNQAGANRVAMANAAARARAGSADDEYRRRMAILGELRGLRGESGSDLPYFQGAGQQYGQGLNAINSRQVETPWWQTGLGIAGSLAGTALPFMGSKGGGLLNRNRSQQNPNMYFGGE